MTDRNQALIETAWENRDSISTETGGDIRHAVEAAIEQLDSGKARVAERSANEIGRAHV